jgi:hypothetical protein
MNGFYDLLYFDLGMSGILKEVGVLLFMSVSFLVLPYPGSGLNNVGSSLRYGRT